MHVIVLKLGSVEFIYIFFTLCTIFRISLWLIYGFSYSYLLSVIVVLFSMDALTPIPSLKLPSFALVGIYLHIDDILYRIYCIHM